MIIKTTPNFGIQKDIFLLLMFLLVINFNTIAQNVKEAYVNNQGLATFKLIQLEAKNTNQVEGFTQIENYPIGVKTSPIFKDQRGITLADIDADGADEIFFSSDNMIYAYKANGDLIWEREVIGIGTFPPTVVDLRDDGSYQLIQTTTGSPQNGRVYLIDAETGEDYESWPLSYDGNMILSAASVTDLTENGVMDIVFSERNPTIGGLVHAVDINGVPINDNWPFELPGTPAFTPSIGDVNNDGVNNIVIATTSGSYYVIDSQSGESISGYPITFENRSFSYQSPILADLTDDGYLEIIAASHGDTSGYFVLDYQGNFKDGWPYDLAGWTYTSPTVADIDGDGVFELFFSDRIMDDQNQSDLPVIYAFDEDGVKNELASIDKYGGTEGIMTIADINADGIMDIIFPSTITQSDKGFIHAFSLDGSGELEGFPLRPKGFTFMNGAVLGSSKDGTLILAANSYTQAQPIDSTFINIYDLQVPYNSDDILSNGYKGNNTRSGLVVPNQNLNTPTILKAKIKIYPNPSSGKLTIVSPKHLNKSVLQVFSNSGKLVVLKKNITLNKGENNFDFSHLALGNYIITVSDGKYHFIEKIAIH